MLLVDGSPESGLGSDGGTSVTNYLILFLNFILINELLVLLI